MFGALPARPPPPAGHGLRRQALRAAGATGQVGTATNHITDLADLATRRRTQAAAGLFDVLWNRLFADPVLLGRYPEGVRRH